MRGKGVFLSITVLLSLFWAGSVRASDAETAYEKAKICYGGLKVSDAKSASRPAWERCINMFEKVREKYPDSGRGSEALYSAGKLRLELFDKTHDTADASAAIHTFNALISEYPDSSFADDALYKIGKLRHDPLKQDDKAAKAFSYIVENYPNGDMAEKARESLKTLGQVKAEPVTVKAGEKKATGAAVDPKPQKSSFAAAIAGPRNPAALMAINVENTDTSTGVSLNLSRKAAYSAEYSNTGLRTKSHPRLELLLMYTKPSDYVEKKMPVDSPFLTRISVKKDLLKGGIRLVFDMAPEASYGITARGDIIKLTFKDKKNTSKPVPQKTNAPKANTDESAKKQTVIVIDPGHGGDDTGAIGPKGLKEKDVTLSISKRLAGALKTEPGVNVYLTRSVDKTLTLEDRNRFAVSKKADLFVSVHANASTNRKMSGIETYYLNNATDAAAAKLAKRENQSSGRKLSDVEHILSTMLQNYDAAESSVLAGDVQRSLMGHVGRKYKGVKNRKVRSAMFYVLVGAKCPAILVETSFISNPREENMLRNPKYQADIAASIAKGIRAYSKSGDERVGAL